MNSMLLEKLPSTPKNGWPWNIETLCDATGNGKILPKISIITPSYNQGEFVEETIRSILLQNYPNLEYIIIDGFSDDNTINIIQKYDRWISYWVSEKDNGQSDAINKGMSRATGDILCWLNSDDYFEPSVLWKIADAFSDCDYNKIVTGDGTFYLQNLNLKLNNHVSNLYEKHTLDYCFSIIQPSTFIGKTAFNINGIFRVDLTYCFDWEWFLRAKKNGIPFVKIRIPLSVYRIHSNHKSSVIGGRRLNELTFFVKTLHGDIMADAYYNLNRNRTRSYVKKLLRMTPSYLNALQYLYWYLCFRKVSFVNFKQLLYTP